jgi:hypothetical protein
MACLGKLKLLETTLGGVDDLRDRKHLRLRRSLGSLRGLKRLPLISQEFTRMMTFRKVGEYVSAEPFRPFRIKMASGQTFEIHHPEMILVGRTSVRVFAPPESDSGNGERWHDVSLMLMETLEPIERAGA